MTYKLILQGKDTRPDSDYDSEQLKNGIEVEYEHTQDKEVAKVITKDHLDEFDDYYIELKNMEEKLKKGSSPEDMEKLIDNGRRTKL